jgi:hypothetical protein
MVKKRNHYDLTYREAKTLFDYDAVEGVLVNKVRRGSHPAGERLTSVAKNGYIRLVVRGHEYLAHRVIWLLCNGDWPKDELDHIDRNKSNNRLANLRECTTAENHQNQDMTSRKGTSRYIGVCKPTHRENWRAQIVVNKRQVYLGMHRCETAAYVAYCRAKSQLHEFVLSDRGAGAA